MYIHHVITKDIAHFLLPISIFLSILSPVLTLSCDSEGDTACTEFVHHHHRHPPHHDHNYHHHHHHHHGKHSGDTGCPVATGTGGSSRASNSGYYPFNNLTASTNATGIGFPPSENSHSMIASLTNASISTTLPETIITTHTSIAASSLGASTTSMDNTTVESYSTSQPPSLPLISMTTTLRGSISMTPPIIAATSTTTAAVASASNSPTSSLIPFLRGVNIGSWLILEQWMAPDMFTGAASTAVDQWTYDQTPNAASNLQQHWLTWFTEDNVTTLSSYGFNALRIPIGYWAYNNTNTPFIQGADAYLEQAIGWARTAGMKVWVDCHGSPGSQNGEEHSGHQGSTEWQQDDNLNRSTAVLVTIAEKYGTLAYADVVVGLEIVNEPAPSGNNSFSTSQQWAVDAYYAIKAVVENQDLVIISHDSFKGPTTFMNIAGELGGTTFGVDQHNYQLYTTFDNSLTQVQHISEACGWASALEAASTVMPAYVGEWCAATNICVNPDGSITAGTSCTISGCQCQIAPVNEWNANMVEQTRKYVEAQLDVWENNTNGYFLWSWGGPGAWCVTSLIAQGVFPNPVTSRMYPSQCG